MVFIGDISQEEVKNVTEGLAKEYFGNLSGETKKDSFEDY